MIKLDWGLQPPESATIAWGARAILRDRWHFDLVWDRQHCQGGMRSDRKRFCREKVDAVLKGGYVEEALRDAFERGELRPNAPNRLTLLEPWESDEGIFVEGDTRGSHGYLYLVAYSTEPLA